MKAEIARKATFEGIRSVRPVKYNIWDKIFKAVQQHIEYCTLDKRKLTDHDMKELKLNGYNTRDCGFNNHLLIVEW